MNPGDPFGWYFEIPIVSRMYFSAAFLTTAGCALEIISPFSLYFNAELIFEKGQVWRLLTNFLFFGMFSIDFVFHMYFLVRYCRLLEENSFRGRTGDFIAFIVFGMVLMMLIAPFINIPFFGSSLSFMMVYLWGRRNEHIRMNFLGLLPFSAPYLPWVLLGFSLLLGNSYVVDLIGIGAGHLYYYLDDIYPQIAELRGWIPRRILRVSYYQQPQVNLQVEQNLETLHPLHGGDNEHEHDGPRNLLPTILEHQDPNASDDETTLAPEETSSNSDAPNNTEEPSNPHEPEEVLLDDYHSPSSSSLRFRTSARSQDDEDDDENR